MGQVADPWRTATAKAAAEELATGSGEIFETISITEGPAVNK